MGEAGVTYFTRFCNKIYSTGHLSEDFLVNEFIPIPKKSGTIECKEHRTISLISHTCKILLHIIRNRLNAKIEENLSEEQNGFRSNRGTRESVFGLRMMGERTIEMQKDVFIAFVDFEKAFDRVKAEL